MSILSARAAPKLYTWSASIDYEMPSSLSIKIVIVAIISIIKAIPNTKVVNGWFSISKIIAKIRKNIPGRVAVQKC